MTIDNTIDGKIMTVSVLGRLDASTAPQLEEVFKAGLGNITDLVVDLAGLEYISSAGLRVLLSAHKTVKKQGKMTIKNVSGDIMDVFEVTGFDSILNIE